MKISGSLVARVARNSFEREVVRAISGIANSIGCAVIAKRIEQPDSLETLTALGVEWGQGFLLHVPETVGAIAARHGDSALASRELVRDAARNEQLLAAFRNQAAVPEPSTPEELAAFQKREREQWATVVRNAKIIVE